MIEKIKELFAKKETNRSRLMKELIRENLDLLPVDIYYIDDPRLAIPPDKLVEYDKKFYDICRDQYVMDRIKYLINKQARMTIQASYQNGTMDALGGININGMATVRDDFIRLGNSYIKSMPHVEPIDELDKFKVFAQ